MTAGPGGLTAVNRRVVEVAEAEVAGQGVTIAGRAIRAGVARPAGLGDRGDRVGNAVVGAVEADRGAMIEGRARTVAAGGRHAAMNAGRDRAGRRRGRRGKGRGAGVGLIGGPGRIGDRRRKVRRR